MKSWTNLLAAIAGAVLLALFATTTPRPVAADAPAADFSAARAMADVREIARAPHPTGSAENARVRAYLMQRLQSLGMTVTANAAPLGAEAQARLDKWAGKPSPAQAVNLVATLPGRDPARPALLLMAHHDSAWGSPGAPDDGTGVAAILEVVRAIRASGQAPERMLIVLFTDAEELGLDGAEHFFNQDPAHAKVGVIVNLEARGGGGRASMFETGTQNGAMIDLFARSVRHPVGTSLSVFVYNKLPNYTDYTVAKKQSVPGFNFAFIGRPGLYHSPLATPDALDQGSLQDIGRQTLDLSRALLAAPELPGKAPDRVFYDLFGLVFLAYPGWAGWLILAAAAGAYGYAAWGRTTLRDLGRGAGAVLALILVDGVLLFAGNLVSGADGKVNYYDRLAAIPRLEIQALLLCLAASALVAGLLLARRPVAPLLPAIAAPWLLLALVAQALAPTAAFPLQIPLLLGGIGAGVARWRGGAAGNWAMTVAGALGVGYMLTLAHQLFQAMGQDMPFLMVVPLGLGGLLLLPLFLRIERPRAMQEAAVLGVLALAIALWVRLDPVAASAAVYSGFH
ncbi:M20/M25/M40 family metallo-hydrolase [Sphingomonas sp. LB-2]|uniref:M20/M25/M40 family metallo-hydrolase n=1 Tax=Sphingomonas caeni TaxID=2984949 RepID=UPI00223206C6|nr:M20/M25/M40 family metallo-hydrolase [Sphingomonas caeni]MCW3847025.1 M20/M25/M40 family metallo-hydrolase [Sphingomonas caeni]